MHAHGDVVTGVRVQPRFSDKLRPSTGAPRGVPQPHRPQLPDAADQQRAGLLGDCSGHAAGLRRVLAVHPATRRCRLPGRRTRGVRRRAGGRRGHPPPREPAQSGNRRDHQHRCPSAAVCQTPPALIRLGGLLLLRRRLGRHRLGRQPIGGTAARMICLTCRRLVQCGPGGLPASDPLLPFAAAGLDQRQGDFQRRQVAPGGSRGQRGRSVVRPLGQRPVARLPGAGPHRPQLRGERGHRPARRIETALRASGHHSAVPPRHGGGGDQGPGATPTGDQPAVVPLPDRTTARKLTDNRPSSGGPITT